MVYCEDVKRNAKTSYMPLRGDEKFIDAVLNTRVSELERGVLERNYNQHSRHTHTACRVVSRPSSLELRSRVRLSVHNFRAYSYGLQ